MHARVQKWGNSLAIRIPKPFASEVGLRKDGEVEISVDQGRLVIVPRPVPAFTLAELLAGVTKANVHHEVVVDGPMGDEVW